MKITYFKPLVLKVKIDGEADKLGFASSSHAAESEIDAKIRKQLDDFLIYWQQQDGIEVTARFTK